MQYYVNAFKRAHNDKYGLESLNIKIYRKYLNQPLNNRLSLPS